MNVAKVCRIHLKAIVAFALLWSFLMPTIESVVTPVSSAIPAVSAGGAGCSSASAAVQNFEKPEEALPFAVFSQMAFPVGFVISAMLLRQARAIPLLMRRLLLRPIKFTSVYVSL
ncbi:hypothetical protein [Paenibacillus flagellatus]|uniref:Uncharacterized protein n=1 Tax=Paenibacillus flagellatus TaxID=2211139 RepID=A0A2V5K7K0_9BACL|nr:hypothetical protein [Paenibacillus flagellatus]PYI53783.1 hypothetical protein DLM86_14570 [Paenibacillus flagellatus]